VNAQDVLEMTMLIALGVALTFPVGFAIMIFANRKPVEQKYGRLSNGGVLFDQVFQPTAYVAREEWESQKIIPVPAPSPDKGPGVIDFESGTVEISLDR
jgi:hypothetical protein